MMNHLYMEEEGSVTEEERRKYEGMREELLRIANERGE